MTVTTVLAFAPSNAAPQPLEVRRLGLTHAETSPAENQQYQFEEIVYVLAQMFCVMKLELVQQRSPLVYTNLHAFATFHPHSSLIICAEGSACTSY
jgi:hypothetical protein